MWDMYTDSKRNDDIVEVKELLTSNIAAARSQLSDVQDTIDAFQDLASDCIQENEEMQLELEALENLVAALQQILDEMETNIEAL